MVFILFLLVSLSSSRENIITSQPGLSIACSKTGTSTTIALRHPQLSYEISGAEWIWTSNSPEDYDFCNVTVSFSLHSTYSIIMVDFESPDAEYVYVNGIKCLSEWNGIEEISSCFNGIGNYQVTFQSKHTTEISGMIFKIKETYSCPDDCFDCMESQCCSTNYSIKGTSCTCPKNTICSCPDNYELRTHDSLQSCFPIEKEMRVYAIISQPGLQIDCSKTGSNATVYSSQHEKFNNIKDATWI